MVVLIIITICLITYLLWLKEVQFEEEQEQIVQQETEANLMQIMQTQNELNNAAFAARKALIEEALKLTQISKQNQFHSEM